MLGNDALFDALADRERRQLLVELLNRETTRVPDPSAESRELLDAHETFLREYLSSSRTVPGVDEATVRLYHDHLPQLVKYGYVEWHRNANLVTRGPQFDDLKPLLRLLDERREKSSVPDAPVVLRN